MTPDGLLTWFLDSADGLPAIFRNDSSDDYVASGFRAAPGQAWATPGQDGQSVFIRWIAPLRGTAGVQGAFQALAVGGARMQVEVLKNDLTLLAEELPLDGSGSLVMATNLNLEIADKVTVIISYVEASPGNNGVGVSFGVRYQDIPTDVNVVPSEQVVPLGKGFEFRAEQSGFLAPSYQWRHSGTNLVDDVRVSGSSTPHLRIIGATIGDSGEYTVVASEGGRSDESAPSRVDVVTAAMSLKDGFSTGANPHSNWTLGWIEHGAVEHSQVHHFTNFFTTAEGFERWSEPSRAYGLPAVLRNGNSARVDLGSFHVESGQIWAVPGVGGLRAVFMWTVPADGMLRVDGRFTIVDGMASNMLVEFLHEGARLDVIEVASGYGQTETLSRSLFVKKGEHLYFVVADGDQAVWGDNLAAEISFDYGMTGRPNIDTQPASTEVLQGEPATLSAAVSGAGPLTFTWLKDGEPVSDSARFGGAASLSLKISPALVSDAGDYVLVVAGPGGETRSAAATLTVRPFPIIIQEPTPYRLVSAGERVAFEVVATDISSAQANWSREGFAMEGAIGPTLVIPNVQPSQGGAYMLRLANTHGSRTLGPYVIEVNSAHPTDFPSMSLAGAFSSQRNPHRNWTLGWLERMDSRSEDFQAFTNVFKSSEGFHRWSEPRMPYGLPGVLRNPLSAAVNLGAFRVRPGEIWGVPGVNGAVAAVKWVAPTEAVVRIESSFRIVDSDASSMLVRVRHGARELGTLNIPAGFGQAARFETNVLAKVGDEFLFLIGDGDHAVWGDNLAIEINCDLAEPQLPQIVDQPRHLVVDEGASSSFSVGVAGIGSFHYQWQKDGVDLTDGPNVTGSRLPVLNLIRCSDAQEGVYTVTVWSGGATVASADATLQIRRPPRITTQPIAYTTVRTGSNVQFRLEAYGHSPLECQWHFNGVEIPGSNELSLSLTNVRHHQSGTYTARIWNSLGSVMSEPAVLQVDDQTGGSVNFANGSASAVFDLDGFTRVSGPAFLVQLYAGPTVEQLEAVGAAVPFLSGAMAGVFSGGVRYVPSVGGGQLAQVQIRVWESGYGSAFEEAVIKGSKFGASTPTAVVLGGAGEPPSPPSLIAGLRSVHLTRSLLPVVVDGPASVTAVWGQEAKVEVIATGYPLLKYQWLRDGVVLEGMTSPEIVLSRVAPQSAGSYSVDVWNDLGTNRSSSASLAVVASLVIAPTEHGSVRVIPEGSVFEVGSTTELWAHPDPGYLFAGWSGDAGGDLNPLALAMDTNRVVGAAFIRGWNVSVSAAARGKVVLTPSLTVYADGSVVDMLAEPEAGFAFTGWSGDVIGNTNPKSVTITTNMVVVAHFRDIEAPLVALDGPLGGPTPVENAVLSGGVSDNVGVIEVRWERDGTPMGTLDLLGGRFEVGGLVLRAGNNRFRVFARDQAGNESVAEVVATWVPSRTLTVGNGGEVIEGQRIHFPLDLSSLGDVGGMSFRVRYDAAVLADPQFTWSDGLDTAIRTINTGTGGEVRGTFSLPATALPGGKQFLGDLSLRARSVPGPTATMAIPDVQDVADPQGNRLTTGTHEEGGSAMVLARRVKGDNNGNSRLDVGDATLIQRLVTGLDEVRAWDVTGNDLNGSSDLDSGDVIRVLRVIVGLDGPPAPPPGLKGRKGPIKSQSLKEGPVGPLVNVLTLTSSAVRVEAGQILVVKVQLQDLDFAPAGASFSLVYPTNALRLVDSLSHVAGDLVGPVSLVVWNVAPGQGGYERQSGRVSFAAISATPWAGSNGVLAELRFAVQPGVAERYLWPVTVSDAEVTRDGYETFRLADAAVEVIGREPQPARLEAGLARWTGEGFRLEWSGEEGARYRVDRSDDLMRWEEVGTATCRAGVAAWVDAGSAAGRRFYRVVLVP